MGILPVIERELRVRSRSGATYWFRPAAAGVGALIALPALFGSGFPGSPSTMGNSIFNGIVGLAFVMCCGACVLTADSLSSERREGTLGLLLTTRLTASDVVLGKLGSTGMASLFALVAFLPVLMIPVLAGGVTAGEAARKALALANTLLFSLAVGLWVSSRGGEKHQMVPYALVLMVLTLILPWLLWIYALVWWVRRDHHRGAFLVAFAAGMVPVFVAVSVGAGSSVYPYVANPVTALWQAGDLEYKASPRSFWVSLAFVNALSWVLIAVAGFRLRRKSAGEMETPVLAAKSGDTWDFWPVRPKRRLHDSAPIEWLVRRQRGMKGAIWTAALVGIGPYLFQPWMAFVFNVVFNVRRTSYPPGRGGLLAFAMAYSAADTWLGFAVAILQGTLFAWAASRFLVSARQSGEMELLLTTPVGAKTIFSGLWRQLWRSIWLPAILLGLTPCLWMILNLARHGSAVWTDIPWALVLEPVLSACNAYAGVVALCWVGMRFGLTARTQAGAIGWTVAMVKGGPYLITTLATLGIMSVGYSRSLGWLTIYALRSLPAQILTLAFLLWLIYRAEARLREAMPGAEPAGFIYDLARTIRRARHWTPA